MKVNCEGMFWIFILFLIAHMEHVLMAIYKYLWILMKYCWIEAFNLERVCDLLLKYENLWFVWRWHMMRQNLRLESYPFVVLFNILA